MAIVITNGTHYIKFNENGKIIKTANEDEAEVFLTVIDAVVEKQKAPKQTQGYKVIDTVTRKVLWKGLTEQEKVEMVEKRTKRPKRKTYSRDARRLIYNKAGGKCELCGKMIAFEDMTIDHVMPLSQGGIDEIDNLQCTCLCCNQFKQNLSPDTFSERVNEIFIYQIEKKYGTNWRWRIVHRLLLGMI